jgi:enoyl-CoA hydratase/carnithine racemase
MKPAVTTEHVQTGFEDGILTLRFNRPEKKNALTLAMYTALVEALKWANEKDAVRVVLLTGGDGCFTSGNDLVDFMNSPPLGDESPVMQFLIAISQTKKPIVAAVSGAAVGVGATMLLHCDLVYAGTSALFQMPFVNLGLCPEAGSTLLLPRMMGHQRAAELLLLGEPFSAETAREVGIVSVVCPNGELLETAGRKARQLAAQPAAAVRAAKALMKQDYAFHLQQAIREEGALFLERLKSPEATEGIRAFLERRRADFSQFS